MEMRGSQASSGNRFLSYLEIGQRTLEGAKIAEHCLPWNELLREGNAWQLFSTKKAATDGLIGKIGEVW